MENTEKGVRAESVDGGNNIGMTQKKYSKLVRRKPYVVAIVVLTVLMVAGAGFGVYGMITRGQADDKVGLLNSELEQKDEALKLAEEKLGAKIEIEPGADTEDEADAPSNTNVVAAKDYVYIGEWGIKIKIPENLHTVSYVFYAGRNVLYVSGAVCDDGRCQYYPAFIDNTLEHGTGLGALSRIHKSEAGGEIELGKNVAGKDENSRGFGRVVYIDDDYFYTYEIANGLMGEQSEAQWEVDSAKAVGEMLMNGVSAF